MNDLRIERARSEAQLADWRTVHNAIIPTAVLSLDEVRERAGRNRLDVAYLGEVAVGCSTVRPPDEEGLRFAPARGFVEVERYVLPGDTVPFVTLRLDRPSLPPTRN
ncbi:hypothetical protein [Streptomyces narbonensis]|uniref:hypothetical protein n=1 Tax=Streptomyces narbonensis TaxID=67333 RepID=UPI0033D760B3